MKSLGKCIEILEDTGQSAWRSGLLCNSAWSVAVRAHGDEIMAKSCRSPSFRAMFRRLIQTRSRIERCCAQAGNVLLGKLAKRTVLLLNASTRPQGAGWKTSKHIRHDSDSTLWRGCTKAHAPELCPSCAATALPTTTTSVSYLGPRLQSSACHKRLWLTVPFIS